MSLYFLVFNIFLWFTLVFVEYKKTKVNFKWLFIVPFCIYVAIRDINVPDTDAYSGFYDITDSTNFEDFGNFSFEIGFQILTKLLKTVSFESYRIYFGFIALINLLIVNFSINKIKNSFLNELCYDDRLNVNFINKDNSLSVLPLSLYVAYYGIYFNAIVLRAGISLSILILIASITIKIKMQLFDYLIVILLFIISYFIHSSTLLGLPIILLLNSKINFEKKTYLWLWLVVGSIYFSNIFVRFGGVVFSFINSLNEFTVLATKLDSYDGNVLFISDEISYKFIFYWIMALILIIQKNQNKIYIKFLNIYFTGLLIFAIFRSVLLIERVTDFYLMFSIISFYLFLLFQKGYKFWVFWSVILFTQLIFVHRITKIIF